MEGILFIIIEGLKVMNFPNSKMDEMIIQEEKIKKIIDSTGPPKFRYHNIIEVKIKRISKVFNLTKSLPKSSLPHRRNGPIIIPKVIGIITGVRIELKKGAPTESLLLKKVLETKGYMVPTSIVKVSEIKKILLSEIAPSLEINFIL